MTLKPAMTPTPLQEAAIEAIVNEPTRAALIADEVGYGKAQPLGALVLTPSGFMKMGEMSVGQEVITPDGGTARVDGVYPQGVRPVYELTLADGRKVRADINHLWSVKDNNRWRGGAAKILTTEELIADLHLSNGGSKWSIDNVSAADFGGEWRSSIDPYFLGILLGDGTITQHTPYVSSADDEILDHIRAVLPETVTLKHSGGYDYRITRDRDRSGLPLENPVTAELRRLGIMGKNAWTKSIPEELLNTAALDRLALLQGLMDSDGAAIPRGGADFVSASAALAEQVAWLIRSLGGRARVSIKHIEGKEYRRVIGRTPDGWPMFRLTRKLAKLRGASKYPVRALAIKSIEYVGDEPTQCIHLDSEDHEYVTDNFTRTHNTLQASEIMLRSGWTRVLLIGIVDTIPQWDETIQRQSQGAAPKIRPLNSTKAGRANYEDFLAGADGIFFASIQWLNAQDFEHRDKLDDQGKPMEKINKKTGEPTGKFIRERVHLRTFAKMSARKNGGLDAVIYDEAHLSANYKSITRRTLLTFRGRGEHAQTFKIGLSATWSGNSFEHAWSIPNWLWPELIPAYWNWHEQWVQMKPAKNADGKDVYVGGKQIMEVVGEKEPAGSFVKSLPCYWRREQEDQAPEALKVYVDSTVEQAAQYADLKADLMTWAMNWEGESEPLVIDIPPALRTRLRQVALAELSLDQEGNVTFAPNAKSAKLQALKGILDHWGDQPVVLFTDSKLMAKLTAERMRAAGYAAQAWTGDTPREERQQIKEAFIAGEIKYIVGTVQSMGTGLDGLQFVCSKAIWLSVPDGDPKLYTQALGRVFRPGRTMQYGEFQHIQLLMRDSLDVETLERLLVKAFSIQASIGAAALAA